MTRLNNERILRLCYRTNSWASTSETLYFQSGREAFLALLRSVKEHETRTVLLPSYVPEGLFAPAIGIPPIQ